MPSATKVVAIENNIPVLQPLTLKSPEAQQTLADFNADIMVVVAYGLLLPLEVLSTPRYGCINVHGSILPKWRGAAPIQRSIWAGNKETGITIMQMDEGLDTGDILHIAKLPILNTDTSASLYEKLACIGPEALLDVLNNWHNHVAQKQNDEHATYAKKLSKAEAFLDWQLPAAQLARNVRAFNPWPICWTQVQSKNVKIWQANVVNVNTLDKYPGTILSANKSGITVATSHEALCISKLQLPGKKPMAVQDIINGYQEWFSEGSVLPSSIEQP